MNPKELAAAAIVTTAAIVSAATSYQVASDIRHDFDQVKQQLSQPDSPTYPTVEIKDRN